jgi:hypothetical protein
MKTLGMQRWMVVLVDGGTDLLARNISYHYLLIKQQVGM